MEDDGRAAVAVVYPEAAKLEVAPVGSRDGDSLVVGARAVRRKTHPLGAALAQRLGKGAALPLDFKFEDEGSSAQGSRELLATGIREVLEAIRERCSLRQRGPGKQQQCDAGAQKAEPGLAAGRAGGGGLHAGAFALITIAASAYAIRANDQKYSAE